MWSAQDWTFFVLPSVVGIITIMFCRTRSSAGSNVKFRPPPWVFSIVWPVLYLLIGLSWVCAMHQTSPKWMCMMLYINLMIVLSLWLIVYACMNKKKWALFVMVLALMITLVTYTWVSSIIAKGVLVPLFVWLIYALLLSVFEIQMSSKL